MEIQIHKDTNVSLHSQLVTQISMQIASGLLKPGAKLPSIRALSQKLGVHHNTCLFAYRELAEIGLIELKHGSGAMVKLMTTDQKLSLPQATTLEQLSDFFTEQVRQRGYPWEQVEAALTASRQKLNGKEIDLVFVDLHEDILPVFKAELESALGHSVQTSTFDHQTLEAHIQAGRHFIVNRYHCQNLHERLKKFLNKEEDITTRMTIIETGSGQKELALIYQLPPSILIVIASVSSIILQQAEAVIRAIHGDNLMIRTALIGKEPLSDIQQACRHAKVIFADLACISVVQAMSTIKIQPIQTISEADIQKLKNLSPKMN